MENFLRRLAMAAVLLGGLYLVPWVWSTGPSSQLLGEICLLGAVVALWQKLEPRRGSHS